MATEQAVRWYPWSQLFTVWLQSKLLGGIFTHTSHSYSLMATEQVVTWYLCSQYALVHIEDQNLDFLKIWLHFGLQYSEYKILVHLTVVWRVLIRDNFLLALEIWEKPSVLGPAPHVQAISKSVFGYRAKCCLVSLHLVVTVSNWLLSCTLPGVWICPQSLANYGVNHTLLGVWICPVTVRLQGKLYVTR